MKAKEFKNIITKCNAESLIRNFLLAEKSVSVEQLAVMSLDEICEALSKYYEVTTYLKKIGLVKKNGSYPPTVIFEWNNSYKMPWEE